MRSLLLSRDLGSILRVLPQLYAPAPPEKFPQIAMSIVGELMPAPYISYDEVDPSRGVVLNELSREPPMPYEEFVAGWEQHVDEHPCIRYAKAGGPDPVVSISDFLTLREFKETGLYHACFKPGGMQHQVALNIPAVRRVVGMGITRDVNFTDRERAIIEVLRPHIAQARANTFFFASNGSPVSPDELILKLDQDGSVRAWSHRIQLILTDYYDCQFRGRWTPPQTLLDWIARNVARLRAGDIRPDAFTPLAVHRGAKHLAIRFFHTPEGRMFVAFEETTADVADPLRYVAIGLTPRQSEILTWVAQGKRDSEIAQIIQSSARTVSNHVYRILGKLGVETRTAAVAEAQFRLQTKP